MRIKVKGYLSLRDPIGGQPFRVMEAEPVLTVQDLIQRLCEELGDDFTRAISSAVHPDGTSTFVAILVNGRHCSHLPHRLLTELADGDEVSIFPPSAGGE